MGTTFVCLSHEPSAGGFWMHDSILELWLRLLALHIPAPSEDHSPAYRIRNQWLLASQLHFNGCVPHGLEDAAFTEEGCRIVRTAIQSLMQRLENSPQTLNGSTLDLLGMKDGEWESDIETRRLIEVGRAFIDLLDGKMSSTAKSTEFMPGSK